MISQKASEDFIHYIKFGYSLKIIQRREKKSSKLSSLCQAIAAIENHLLMTKYTDRRRLQMSLIHLIGSFCRVFDMSVVVYVEEPLVNQKKYSTTIGQVVRP